MIDIKTPGNIMFPGVFCWNICKINKKNYIILKYYSIVPKMRGKLW